MRATLRAIPRSLLVAIAFAAIACTDIGSENEPPEAVAVALVAGMPAMSPLAFMGTPLMVTLDGTASTDPDGRIVSYTWLQTDVSPGVRYSFPTDAGTPAAFTGDPPPGPVTQVLFNGPATAQYSLWVTDDDGADSEPAVVDLEVATPFMPDAACLAAYPNPNATCADCVCTPNAMMGCFDEYAGCFMNADPTFATLCTAVIQCGLTAGCKGSACYTGGCMAEIDAAATHMGGTLADCSAGDPAVSPCRAANVLGACTNMTSCATACM